MTDSWFTRFLLVLCLVLLADGCGSAPEAVPPPDIDAANAFRLVGEICDIGPRPSGSDGGARTAQYIVDTATAYGYEPIQDTWTERTARGSVEFTNITAELGGGGGDESLIIIGTHFDTKILAGTAAFVGANDGASSTALVLELMRALKETSAAGRSTVRFAFLDGEEAFGQYSDSDGLHGSRRMARQLQESGRHRQCRAMILLDMVGDKDLTVTISPTDSRELRTKLFYIAEQQGTRKYFGYFMKGSILDDHIPFSRLGIPVLDIIDFKYGPNNSYWHTDQDTIDKLSADSLAIVGNAVIALICELNSE
jgi:glutaminyl-peptide cyclotransferase